MNYIRIKADNIDSETIYWVPRVEEAAQSAPTPVTTYALFRDGTFLTQVIRTDQKFLALAEKTARA